MAERWSPEVNPTGYVYWPDEHESSWKKTISADEVSQGLEMVTRQDDKFEAFFEQLGKYDDERAVFAARAIVSTVRHISLTWAKRGPVPVAVLTEGESGSLSCRLGTLNRESPVHVQADDANFAISNKGRRLQLGVILRPATSPVVSSCKSEVPFDVSYNIQDNIIASVQELSYFASQSGATSWELYRGYADLIVAGDQVKPVLEANGFRHAWAAYAAPDAFTYPEG